MAQGGLLEIARCALTNFSLAGKYSLTWIISEWGIVKPVTGSWNKAAGCLGNVEPLLYLIIKMKIWKCFYCKRGIPYNMNAGWRITNLKPSSWGKVLLIVLEIKIMILFDNLMTWIFFSPLAVLQTNMAIFVQSTYQVEVLVDFVMG